MTRHSTLQHFAAVLDSRVQLFPFFLLLSPKDKRPEDSWKNMLQTVHNSSAAVGHHEITHSLTGSSSKTKKWT